MGQRKRRAQGAQQFAPGTTIAKVTRGEGGSVQCELAVDLQPEEMAALMVALSDQAKARGWNPALLSMEYNAIEMRRRGLTPAPIPDHLRQIGGNN